ncbi:MAG TPA: hypothetical protein VJI15_04105 [Candidatus Nanoarchaeia archaeon]|nr:hypothetical protein [Candidatus Nanoarchaeia archaeon]
MVFAAQFSILDIEVPVIGYVHAAGFAEAFPSRGKKKTGSVPAAIQYTKDFIGGNPRIFLGYGSPVDYLIVALWGDDGVKVIEAFGYEHVEPQQWPGNPERHSWVFRDQVHGANIVGKSCLETDAMLGAEASHRLQYTKTLDEFLRNRPYLFDLEPDVRLKR